MRSRDGFILVFSVVDRTTFNGLDAFYEQLTVMHEEKIPPIVVGTSLAFLPLSDVHVMTLCCFCHDSW
jgi:hypothetical protein